MTDYCEWCGDILGIGGLGHSTVSRCVPLCEKCGGMVPEDERWAGEPLERCSCTERPEEE